MTIDETIEFIKGAHAGQRDKGGNPYWLHPVAVMMRLPSDATQEERQVALLHDVIEDTPLTASHLLAAGFSQNVVDAVVLLSRPTGPERPTYINWIKKIKASRNEMAIRVKIADNEENCDPERIAQLPEDQRGIRHRYERSLAILRGAES